MVQVYVEGVEGVKTVSGEKVSLKNVGSENESL